MCSNSLPVDQARISQLLSPYLEGCSLSETQTFQISTYIDLLVRWNARINLTAIRDEENIVTRHFGESLFVARTAIPQEPARLVDVGSGAGFPGLPIKVWAPHLHVTLTEANNKKATFLREVLRALRLSDIEVFAKRVEDFPAQSADVVTLRAVERFDTILLSAARLVASGGRLVLLISRHQISRASGLAGYHWAPAKPLPGSTQRVVLVGSRNPGPNQ